MAKAKPSGAALFLDAGAQLQVAHQAMQIVGMNAQLFGGLGDAAIGLLESIYDQLFFEIADRAMILRRSTAFLARALKHGLRQILRENGIRGTYDHRALHSIF